MYYLNQINPKSKHSFNLIMYWSKYLLKIDLSLFLLQLIVYHIILQKSVEH